LESGQGMIKAPDSSRGDLDPRVAVMAAPGLQEWFVREVLPLEAVLRQFLRRSLRDRSNIDDLVQEVYVRVCEAANDQIPQPVRPFVFTIARNLLVDRVRREQVVSIEAVEDLEALNAAIDMPGPEQSVIAREELRRLQAALDRLPPRAREALLLRKVEGLSWREIAARMGITEGTVNQHLKSAIRSLTYMLYGEPGDLRSSRDE
jgi:RNA polymerase sigma factor (sigma-70 family)